MPELNTNYCDDHTRTEKINGVVYNMSPAADFRHSIINGNIYRIIAQGLKDSVCMVFMENLDFMFHPDVNDDYVEPDIMIVCDRKNLKKGFYRGVPKFVAETLSPATARRDKTEKKEIYEQAGVDEYWLVSPRGKEIEIYYLQEGKYQLVNNYILEEDKEDAHYNAQTVISLKNFPNISMTLEEIFQKVDE